MSALGQCAECGDDVATKKNGKKSRYCGKHLAYNRERMRRKLKLKSRYRGAASYKIETATKKR